MPNRQIEIILARQLADSLSIAVFLVDVHGNLIFYNEPAEELLGLRFEQTGFIKADEWASIFKPQDKHGEPLNLESLPLVKTLRKRTPEHGGFWIKSLDGKVHKIAVTTFPIIGRPSRFVGAMALFWKSPES